MKPIGLFLAEFKPLPVTAEAHGFGTRTLGSRAAASQDVGPQGFEPQDLELQDFKLQDFALQDFALQDLGSTPGVDGALNDPTLSEASPDGIAEARQAGFEAGQAVGQAAMEATLEALRETHALERAAERQDWAERQAAEMVQLAQNGLAALETDLATTLAELVQPLLSSAARAKALADMREAIETLMRGDGGALIAVSGPADLAEPLRAAFAGQPNVEVSHAEAFEVTVRAGDTTIRTHLQAWADGLAARFAEDPA